MTLDEEVVRQLKANKSLIITYSSRFPEYTNVIRDHMSVCEKNHSNECDFITEMIQGLPEHYLRRNYKMYKAGEDK